MTLAYYLLSNRHFEPTVSFDFQATKSKLRYSREDHEAAYESFMNPELRFQFPVRPEAREGGGLRSSVYAD